MFPHLSVIFYLTFQVFADALNERGHPLLSSTSVTLTPLFQWLGQALRVVTERSHEMWKEIQEEAGITGDRVVPPWMLDSADLVTEQVEQMADEPLPKHSMQCDDIEQLFTNIPHKLLIEKLEKCINMIWERMHRKVKEAHHRSSDNFKIDDMVLIVYGKYGVDIW